MADNLNPVAVGAVGVGLIFVWTGLRGGSVLRTFQELVQGQKPSGNTSYPVTTPIGSADASSTDQMMDAPSSDAPGGTVAENKAIAKGLAAKYGWDSGAQWDALVWIWQHESSWSNTAENASGAYGIPQALPPTKLPKAGRPPKLGGTSNAGAQITWGLSYIKDRYGDPVSAKAFWQAHNWY